MMMMTVEVIVMTLLMTMTLMCQWLMVYSDDEFEDAGEERY